MDRQQELPWLSDQERLIDGLQVSERLKKLLHALHRLSGEQGLVLDDGLTLVDASRAEITMATNQCETTYRRARDDGKRTGYLSVDAAKGKANLFTIHWPSIFADSRPDGESSRYESVAPSDDGVVPRGRQLPRKGRQVVVGGAPALSGRGAMVPPPSKPPKGGAPPHSVSSYTKDQIKEINPPPKPTNQPHPRAVFGFKVEKEHFLSVSGTQKMFDSMCDQGVCEDTSEDLRAFVALVCNIRRDKTSLEKPGLLLSVLRAGRLIWTERALFQDREEAERKMPLFLEMPEMLTATAEPSR